MRPARKEYADIRCSGCGERAHGISPMGTCVRCGGILFAKYDMDRLRSLPRDDLFSGTGVWRYSRLLPIPSKEYPITLGEGGTTLLRSERLGEILGMKKLFLKNETTNPTGSFVDRGTAVEITHARNLGHNFVSCAFSGNLAASVAAYAARAGMQSEAILPPGTDIGKLYQIVAYGARIIQVRNQEEAEEKLMGLERERHCITSQSPFFLEGIKTSGLEIAEQFGFSAPDRIILSIGSGAHLTMIWKALKELEELDIMDASRTKMTGVQIAGCAPIVDALGKKRRTACAEERISLAREIAIHHPHLTDSVLDAIRKSGGTAIAVDEREIIDSVQLLARAEGIFAEPSAAATIAGLRNLLDAGEIDSSEKVVCVITGTGLKEPIASPRTMRKVAGSRRTALRMERRIEMLDLGRTKESILELLRSKDDYGYGIWKRLRDEKGIDITVVSVYQHLSELEAADLVRKGGIQSSPKRRARVLYVLTQKGRRFLSENMRAG
ncbi:MAG: threonine synthase [Thermoplasmata archaeon]